MTKARETALHFLKLPFHIQVKIAQTIGVFTEGDQYTHGTEVFGKWFKIAIKNKTMDKFSKEINSQYAIYKVWLENNP